MYVSLIWEYIFCSFDLILVFSLGCFADGLFLEGAGWDRENSCLVKQNPKQLIEELPVLKIIPIEAHRLKLEVNCLWFVYKAT